MPDVVVTVPKSFGLGHWIAERDAAGEPESGEEWGFFLGGHPPNIAWHTELERDPPTHGPGLWVCTQWGGRMDVTPNGRDYMCLQTGDCPLSQGDNPRCHLLYEATPEDFARESRVKEMWEEQP